MSAHNGTVDFQGIASLALSQSRSLIPQWLPNGKLHGAEYRCGGLDGSPGESFAVNLNKGAWSDFATGAAGGDLVSLYAALHRTSQIEAARELSDTLLGSTDPRPGVSSPALPKLAAQSDWAAIIPVPADAPPPPPEHFRHGQPSHIARYLTRDGGLVGYIYRCDTETGKEIYPLTFCQNARGRNEWRWLSFPKPRSLYGAELLNEGGRVLLVEGEGKCDAARRMLGDSMTVIAWPGGAKAVQHADWSMLAGRDVVIWPDADSAGITAAAQIAIQLRHHGATVRIVEPPSDVPKGWDLADAERDGWSGADVAARIDALEPERREPEPRTEIEHFDFAPLGHDRGRFFFFTSGGGQVRDFSSRDLQSIGSLCELAPLRYWEMNHPGKGDAGFNLRSAGDSLVRSCYRAGIYDAERLRGRGAWLDEGRTVLHIGDKLIVDGVEIGLASMRSKFIYEQGRRLSLALGDEQLSSERAKRLMDLCMAAPWEDSQSMGRLLAGWLVIAPVCGAMPWRPHIWVTGEAGSGKAQPHSAAILTRHGWSTIGEMRVGDWVKTPDNKAARILRIFPQGKQLIYKLTFSDGRTTRATGDHLWKVRVKNEWRLRTTDQMIADIKADGRTAINLAIPVPAAQNLNDKKFILPLHPYALGVLLGDGHLANAEGSKKAGEIRITSADPEIFARVSALVGVNNLGLFKTNQTLSMRLGSLDRYGREARKMIGDLRLLGKRSDTKFVPGTYLSASIEDRIELLKGLMDTDGTISENGSVSFCTCSERLAKDVQYLVRSLGGLALIGTKTPHCTYLGERVEGKRAYIVNIRLPDASIAFHLPRKLARVNPTYQYADSLFSGVKSIEPDCEEDASCISIDHPDRLYITDDFVVTHNTWIVDNLIRPVVGDIGLPVASKTSEAGVRGDLGLDARPVIFDEFESQNEHDRARVQQVLDLARQASSEDGAAIIKGTQTGGSRRYRIRSCFAFSSINLGLQQAADESRTVVLTVSPSADPEARRAAFQELLRLHAEVMTLDFRPALLARTLSLLPTIRANAEMFASAIARAGVSRRTGDTIGVLLAGAWSLRSRKVASAQEADQFVASKAWVKNAVGRSEADPEWRRAIDFLVQVPLRTTIANRNTHQDIPIGELISVATYQYDNPIVAHDEALSILARAGIRIEDGDILIATASEPIRRAFSATSWASSWATTIARTPGAEKLTKATRFASLVSKGLRIHSSIVMGEFGS